MNRLLDKVNNLTAVLIALVLLISVNGFLYFYSEMRSTPFNYRASDRGPIVVEEAVLPRAEGASAGTPKKDAAPEVERGAVGGDRDEASPVREAGPHPPQPAPASSKASDEVGLPVGTSAVSPTVPAAPQGTAPPSTATPTATASSTAAATAPPATAPPATATDAPTLQNTIEEGQNTIEEGLAPVQTP